MEINVKLEQGKMSERQVRDAIDRAARTARDREQMNGKSDIGQERAKDLVRQKAEMDHSEGKI